MIGDKYNKLTIIRKGKKLYQPSGQYQWSVICKCDCGKTKEIRLAHLKRGKIKSCGCICGGLHGESGTKLHTTWRGMKNRCKPYHSESYLYYDKGVRLYKEWEDYLVFREWALSSGYKEGLQIDRINSNGNYEPKNCRFVTPLINSCNRNVSFMVDYNGEKKSLRLLVNELGLDDRYKAIYTRVKRGWDVHRAIYKEVH